MSPGPAVIMVFHAKAITSGNVPMMPREKQD